MPAKTKPNPKRPRLQLTPSPELWRLIDLVHEKTGQSRASVVAELLDEVAPAFQTMINALELAQSAPRQAQQLMNNFSAQAVSQLMQQQLDLDAAIDARTVKGKRARRGKRGA
jgi:hypothetical protein